jgi:7,8-dihydropterin-6-yl-methyl-4-(beta-D-ribofuranosyl)aminobenzene 5'-phosphate synthase
MTDLTDVPKITVLYDNRAAVKGLRFGWGFSALIEYADSVILFDTADNADYLSENLKALEIDIERINALVISHDHWDHNGGIKALAARKAPLNCFVGKGVSDGLRRGLREMGFVVNDVTGAAKVAEGIYTGPEFEKSEPPEIPLCVKTNGGMYIVTGCAHPGIYEISSRLKKDLNSEIRLIVGGFHLKDFADFETTVNRVKILGVKYAAPCHCSGKNAIVYFKKVFGDDFIDVGSGTVINI